MFAGVVPKNQFILSHQHIWYFFHSLIYIYSTTYILWWYQLGVNIGLTDSNNNDDDVGGDNDDDDDDVDSDADADADRSNTMFDTLLFYKMD